MGRCRVSVIIATHDYARFLPAAVDSVLAQTYRDWELVIVDDCSSDDSYGVAQAYQSAHAGTVRAVRMDRNSGVSACRNRGAALARGEMLAFLDADDSWMPRKLHRQVACLDETGMDMVHTGVDTVSDDETIAYLKSGASRFKDLSHWDKEWNQRIVERKKRYRGNYFQVLLNSSPICLSSALMRRDLYENAGGFEQGLLYQTEDWLLWLKCALLGRIAFLPDRLTRYRVHMAGYSCRHYVTRGCDFALARAQVHDRCLQFARRAGIALARKDFTPPWNRGASVAAARRTAGRLLRCLRQAHAGLSQSLRRRAPGRGTDAAKERLDQLVLFVTGACNLRCSICFYADSLNKTEPMSMDAIRKMCDSIRAPRFVMLTGGEPFLRRDIDAVISCFLRKGPVSVNTNGTLPRVTAAALDRALAQGGRYPLQVSVSIDAFEEQHDRLRGKAGTFQSALDTLRLLLALRRKHALLSVVVNTVVMPQNLNTVLPLMDDLWSGFDLDYHNIEIIRGNAAAAAGLARDAPALRSTIRGVCARIRRRNFLRHAFERKRLQVQCDALLAGREWGVPCRAGSSIVVVYDDASMAACELRGKVVDLHDFDCDIRAALRSDAFQKERAAIAAERCSCIHGCWLSVSLMRGRRKRR